MNLASCNDKSKYCPLHYAYEGAKMGEPGEFTSFVAEKDSTGSIKCKFCYDPLFCLIEKPPMIDKSQWPGCQKPQVERKRGKLVLIKEKTQTAEIIKTTEVIENKTQTVDIIIEDKTQTVDISENKSPPSALIKDLLKEPALIPIGDKVPSKLDTPPPTALPELQLKTVKIKKWEPVAFYKGILSRIDGLITGIEVKALFEDEMLERIIDGIEIVNEKGYLAGSGQIKSYIGMQSSDMRQAIKDDMVYAESKGHIQVYNNKTPNHFFTRTLANIAHISMQSSIIKAIQSEGPGIITKIVSLGGSFKMETSFYDTIGNAIPWMEEMISFMVDSDYDRAKMDRHLKDKGCLLKKTGKVFYDRRYQPK